ncbi:MAG: hypothetical protein CL581_14365 [Alteromonadaceae bacterium]|uniref:hypothetical protein n=1 Tax=unclassified Marinobacter TaxID=83889 RepID=UPI000C59B07C|nr:hypothetical protein [Marinobacter sp. BGYM27]MAA65944.1 hypothetical protein [Alteromonadaceae bacterium]MBH86501.1 hypothetical protein [Alteromonadaceae bacterium]MDG5501119.1 hypothetical protein [Marinobacter sp. BGYM27]|tara:strand:- start:174 stop:410 length:237 start_codon:yes stop_codon:yes gene_type:complete
MNSKALLDVALKGLDSVGYQLDSLGITSKINRHTLIAYAMAEQKHLEGEWDSLQARYGSQIQRVEKIVNRFRGNAARS